MRFLKTILILVFITIFATSSLLVHAAPQPPYALLSDVRHFTGNECAGKYEGKFECVSISFSAERDFSTFTLTNPDRIVIDVKDALYDGATKTIKGGDIVQSIRYAQNEKNIVRIVLDTKGRQNYKLEREKERINIYVGDIIEKTGKDAGEENEVKQPENESQQAGEQNKERSRDEQNREQNPASRGSVDRGQSSAEDSLNIGFASKESVDEVSIFLDNYKGYNISTLSDPDRIIIDIPGVIAPVLQQEIKVNGTQVRAVRYAQYSENTARVVVDTIQRCPFNIKEYDGQLVLNVESPKFNNITYNNNGDRVYLSIQGASLTEGGQDLRKFYTEKYSSDGTVYILSFRSSLVNLPQGVIQVNDRYLESITISKSLFSFYTDIIFKAKDKFVYQVMARPDLKDTAITILKPASKSDKLVVIDAGHGGVEPGAVYGSLQEKNLNLDIALRLNELLKKKNVKTYMIRENDSFVGLYERAYIANNLNASLFLSIHNNAMEDRSFGGTMTLYYVTGSESKGFNSYKFSNIIQNELIKTMGTKDRKVRERPELVVLKATKMPASLAEIAFMTNSDDRAKLQNSEFKQKAAQALCDAVIKSLSEIK
ncbi:MAG TPA: N-acetylmuramoyl-L-alanine amidase [Clostridiales bacterium]|nr:N-acetylmuramoyl-L-alanine amidase [Clostridiales bacterium]